MSDNDKQKQETPKEGEVKAPENQNNKEENKELTLEEKLKETEEKLLRSLAEIENQRRRFEKEIKDAFEFGSFNFCLLYTSPSPRDGLLSRMPSSA